MRVGLIRAWLGCAMCLLLPVSARAQTEDRPLADSVRSETLDPCMPAQLLVVRIAHWLRHDQLDARIAVRVFDRSHLRSFEILFQGNVVAERTFDVLPRDCAARRDAFALAVALALDNVVQRREEIAAEIAAAATVAPTTGDGAVTAGDAASVAATADHVMDDDVAVASQPTADAPAALEPPLQLGLALGVAALVHELPGLSALGEAAIELSAGSLMGRLGVLASTPADASLAGGEVTTRLLGGRADLCVVRPVSTLGVLGCAGLQAGAVHMAGQGFMRSDTSVQAWVTGAARFALEWPRGVLRARVFAEGVIPLLSPAAQVVDADGNRLGKLTTVRVGVILGLSALVVFR